jgi:hypothetical protein
MVSKGLSTSETACPGRRTSITGVDTNKCNLSLALRGKVREEVDDGLHAEIFKAKGWAVEVPQYTEIQP